MGRYPLLSGPGPQHVLGALGGYGHGLVWLWWSWEPVAVDVSSSVPEVRVVGALAGVRLDEDGGGALLSFFKAVARRSRVRSWLRRSHSKPSESAIIPTSEELVKVWNVLAWELDEIEWDSRSDEEIAGEVLRERPLWVRFANFFRRNISVLRHLPPGQLVLWKLEHWGADTDFDRVPASEGVDLLAYVREMFDLGHLVVPYTFVERNRELLYEDIPLLDDRGVQILPVAQKRPVGNEDGSRLRAHLRVGKDEILLGAGGLLHPAKGVDEIASWFLSEFRGSPVHLLCSVIPDDEEISEKDIRHRWEKTAGVASSAQLHVRVSRYGQWEWMCEFYRAIDGIVVNSVSDSWGRMLSEPVGFGIPAVVRRADCATNHIVPGVVMAGQFSALGRQDFLCLLDEARIRAPRLADYVNRAYAPEVVCKRMVDLLGAYTPQERKRDFARLAGQARSRRIIRAMAEH